MADRKEIIAAFIDTFLSLDAFKLDQSEMFDTYLVKVLNALGAENDSLVCLLLLTHSRNSVKVGEDLQISSSEIYYLH